MQRHRQHETNDHRAEDHDPQAGVEREHLRIVLQERMRPANPTLSGSL